MERNNVRELPGPGRLEAFSDGVLAIAITLLVLEIKVPHVDNVESTREALLALVHLAPKFLGYMLSFLFIAVFWVNHHRFFQLVDHIDTGLLWMNTLLLLAISFIPFPTAFIGEYPWNGSALALFSVVLMVAGIVFHLMWRRADAKALLHSHVDAALVQRATARGRVGPIMYALAAGLAFAFPIGSWLLFLAVPLFYALPGRADRNTPAPRKATSL